MIQWLFSFSKPKRLLEKMTSEITAILKKNYKTTREGEHELRSVVIRIGVVCQTGAQLAPCFVEELFSHFSYGPVVVEGLCVTRHHWDALRGVWGQAKDLLWQTSRYYVLKHRAVDLEKVLESSEWGSFSATSNAETESKFASDPYCNEVKVGDMLLDFEAGLTYDRQRGRQHYLRCTHLTRSRVNAWLVSSQGYKAVSRSFRAAGILPYSVHPMTGEAVFLLGKLTYGWRSWCDFGGLKSFRYTPPT